MFAISLILRLGIIALTPGADRYIDIDIYRCSGALVKSGVNPWDFSASPEIREKPRENSEVERVKESQERWNFYFSGNLPFNLLYFAGIDLVPWDFHIFTIIETLWGRSVVRRHIHYASGGAVLYRAIAARLRPRSGNPFR